MLSILLNADEFVFHVGELYDFDFVVMISNKMLESNQVKLYSDCDETHAILNMFGDSIPHVKNTSIQFWYGDIAKTIFKSFLTHKIKKNY